MFIKPFQVKSNVQMKGSEVKKFKQKLTETFNISESDLSTLFPSKSAYSIVKIVTKCEDDGNVTVLTIDKRPMFFEHKEKWYPTVYTLWIVPDMVPYFTTHAQVNLIVSSSC